MPFVLRENLGITKEETDDQSGSVAFDGLLKELHSEPDD